MLWLDESGASERASNDAEKSAIEDARQTLRYLRCPRCRQVSEKRLPNWVLGFGMAAVCGGVSAALWMLATFRESPVSLFAFIVCTGLAVLGLLGAFRADEDPNLKATFVPPDGLPSEIDVWRHPGGPGRPQGGL